MVEHGLYIIKSEMFDLISSLISSCFPVLESYVERPFTSYGQPVVMKRREKIMEIETKLKRILAFEANRPDYFPQKITTLKNYLLSIR